jgi:hypothetical protein
MFGFETLNHKVLVCKRSFNLDIFYFFVFTTN